MRNNFFKFLIFIVTIGIFSSCLWNDDDETELSNNPNFVSLKFSKNDSIPGLDGAVFTFTYDSIVGDSIIVNLDSLPYLTRIDSVFPTFTFRSTSASYLVLTDSLGTGLDSIGLSGKDTVDFTKVLHVTNIAQDKVTERTYKIKVNVHQVQPELYQWQMKKSQIYTHSGSVQQAVFFQNKFYFYVSSGVNNYLYTSADAVSWANATVTGLPPYSNLRDITTFNNKLYLVHEDGRIFSTGDGIIWTSADPDVAGYTIHNLLFALENNLWSVFQQQANQKYYFATSADGIVWQIEDELPAKFPIVDFAALSFQSRTKKPKAIVLGGYAPNGELLSSVWSVQKNINNEYKWVNFALNKSTMGSLAGASVIPYDNKLLLYGGMDINDNVVENHYMESFDEGFSWRRADALYNVIEDLEIPFSYQPRSYQSVIHDEASHYIYLIGGRTKNQVFSDVWVGKLNRMSFIRK